MTGPELHESYLSIGPSGRGLELGIDMCGTCRCCFVTRRRRAGSVLQNRPISMVLTMRVEVRVAKRNECFPH